MATIEPTRFRQVLGHFPTGVTIITGVGSDGQPAGITIGSFASVSLDPPLVGFLPGLGADQGELCWRFAKEAEGRYEGIDWTAAPSGSPILPGVIGWIDCSIEQTYTMGDHWFVLGRVQELHCDTDATDAMIFFKGKVSGVRAI